MKWLRKQIYEYRPQPSRSSASTRFDQDSGQIYSETILAIEKESDRGWDRCAKLVVGPSYRDTKGYDRYSKQWQGKEHTDDLGQYRDYMDSVKNSKVRGLVGSRSLEDVAIECILKNIADITVEGIECLPIQLVRRIWHAVNRRCTQSFNTWSMFATVLRRECDIPTLELLRFRQSFPKLASPLSVYITPITSNTFNFLTSLSITTPVSVPELCALSGMRNLGTLALVNIFKTDNVSDRLVRAWHLAARDEGAFPVLRMLRLWYYPDITNDSLAYLNSFPALAVFDAKSCGISGSAIAKSRAREIGWEIGCRGDVLEWLDGRCADRICKLQNHLSRDGVGHIRKTSSVPLYDASSVRMIPRAEVHHFLTGQSASMDGVLAKYGAEISELPTENRRSKVAITRTVDSSIQSDVSDHRDLGDNHSLHNKRGRKKTEYKRTEVKKRRGNDAPETWDFKEITSFARIGELRDDVDLTRAGVNIRDAAAVGDEFVTPVPMVSVCLGPTRSIGHDGGAVFFVRINISKSRSKETAIQKAPETLGGKRKAEVSKHSVMKAKKRNLGDLLDSFM